MKLEGKVAIVTGAGQGIGREYAKALSREGAKVVVAEIKEETGRAVAEEISGLGGDASFVRLDLASEASCLEVCGGGPGALRRRRRPGQQRRDLPQHAPRHVHDRRFRLL